MPWSQGQPNTLWHAKLKINTDFGGYNFRFSMAGLDEDTAMTRAIDIASRYKKLMPADSEIFYATLSMDNPARDSAFIRAALGSGGHVGAGQNPPPTTFDSSFVSLMVRLEDADRQEVTRKFNPVPDEIVSDQKALLAIADITAPPALPLPAVGAGANWGAEFSTFMAALVAFTHHIKSGHAPGGAYQYQAWRRAYFTRVGKKKGGRVFV